LNRGENKFGRYQDSHMREAGELPTILRNVDLERIARGEGVPGDWLCGSVR